jgi:integrase
VQVRKSGCASVNKTFDRLTDARAWASETEKTIARTGRERHIFRQLADKYVAEVMVHKKNSTQRTQKGQIDRWRAALGAWDLRELNADLILDNRNWLQERYGFGPATANRYMAVLNHCLNFGVAQRWLTENCLTGRPYKHRGCEKSRTRFLNDDEVVQLTRHCRGALRTIVTLALHTGMRKSEILNLTWGDYDVKNQQIFLKDSKNNETRLVSLSHFAVNALREWGRVRRIDSPLIFPSPSHLQKPINIDRGFRNAVKAAKLEGVRFHDLRHTTATHLALAGVDALLIADILGHKTLDMTRRYAHLSNESKRAALEKVSFSKLLVI